MLMESPGPFCRLLIPRTVLDTVVAHAREAQPNECCGLLAGLMDGETGRVTLQFPLRNDLLSPTAFATNPRDMLDASKAMRADGTDVLAIYHSHPTSAPVPSRKDIERNSWGVSVVHLIVGLGGTQPEIRAWWLTDDGYTEAIWEGV
jgi:proteasome lid subunit RPN8/RPN11